MVRATVPTAAGAPPQGRRRRFRQWQRSHALREVLRRPDFRRLYGTRLTSQCADGVFQASLAGVVLFSPESAGDPAEIASAFAVLLLPYSLIGPFAGVLLDRWRRQRVLLWSNLLRCLLVGVVALEIATRVEGVPFYATALLVTSVNRFFLAAQSAAQPHVVEPERAGHRQRADRTTSGSVATAVGLGVAVLLRQVVGNGDGGYALIALTSILGYGSSAFLARRFAPDQLGPDDVRRSRRETVRDVARGLVAGARHVAERREVASALAAIGAHRFFYGISTISILLLYRNYFTDHGVFQAGLAGLGAGVRRHRRRHADRGGDHAGRGPPRIGKHAWITGLFALAALTEIVFGLPYEIADDPAGRARCSASSPRARRSAWTRWCRSRSTTTSAAGCSPSTTRCSTSRSSPPRWSPRSCCRSAGKSYAMLAVVSAGYALTALGYGLAGRRLPRRPGRLS